MIRPESPDCQIPGEAHNETMFAAGISHAPITQIVLLSFAKFLCVPLLGVLGEAPRATLQILCNFMALLGGLGAAHGVTLQISSIFLALSGPPGGLDEAPRATLQI